MYVHNIAMIRLGRMRSMNRHHHHQHTLSFHILENFPKSWMHDVCRVQPNYSGQAR